MTQSSTRLFRDFYLTLTKIGRAAHTATIPITMILMDNFKRMTSSIIPFYKQYDKWIVKSSGCYLYDSDNNPYLDFEAGDWAAGIGHANERVNAVIKNQVDLLIHDGLRFRNK